MSEDLNNEVPENMEGEEIDNIVILMMRKEMKFNLSF